MAVLTNTMLQGSSADTEAAAFKIEKSLRWNSADSPVLKKSDSASGNGRTWTLSYWIKRSKLGSYQWNVVQHHSGQQELLIGFRNDDTFGAQINTTGHGRKTTAVFRDLSAYYNFTIVCSTTEAYANDRLRIYCNGARVDTTDGDGSVVSANEVLPFNQGRRIDIGSYQSGATYSDGYIADVQFIDGLALSPAAFGEFDSAGAWNPKEFSLPQINDGTTWSTPSYWSGTEKSDAPYDNGFDGDTSNTIAKIDNSSTSGWYNYTFTPPNPITFVDRVEVHGSLTSVRWSINGEPWTTGSSNGIWDTIATGGGTITTIDIEADNHYPEWRAIRIDGTVLLDGKTDPTWDEWKAVNTGKIWSNESAGTAYNNFELVNAFRGHIANSSGETWMAVDNGWSTWKPLSDVVASTSIRVYASRHGDLSGITAWIKNCDVDITTTFTGALASGEQGWVTLPTTGGAHKVDAANGFTIYRRGSDGHCFRIWAIEVDGVILTDGNINSFHLKFNDVTSPNDSLGRNTFCDINASNVGALPIYNTSNDFTLAKGSGYRSDPLAANLVFAMPGDVLTDEHDEIKGSGSAKTVTNDGVAVSTDQSKLYGSSLRIEGTDMLSCASNADFNLHGGDWCVEGWFYSINDTGAQQILIENGTGGTTGWSISRGTDRRIHFYAGGTSSMGNNDTTLTPDDEWYHLALVRNGSNTTLYINGNPVRTESHDSADGQDGLWIGERSNSSLGFNGYAQDIRIYKGHRKYSGRFIPVRSRDFSVTNFNYASSTGVTTGGSWSTAFKTGGSVSFNGGTDWVISSGSSVSTAGNATRLLVDTGGLGDSFELTIEDTGGANSIYYTSNSDASSSSFSLHQNNVTKLVITPTGIDSDGTFRTFADTVGRYLRLEGSGGGNCTMTVTGVLDLDAGTCASVTGVDSLTDTPTNYGTDGGAGGQVRGNFCTFNALSTAGLLSQGNLTLKGSGGYDTAVGTVGANTGKWYAEFYITGNAGGYAYAGIAKAGHVLDNERVGNKANAYGCLYYSNANYASEIKNNASSLSSVPGANLNTVFPGTAMVAMDIDAKKIWYGWNGTWFENASGVGNPATGANPMVDSHANFTDGFWTWAASPYHTNAETMSLNAGQTPFKYTAPSGFKALCTQNLDDTFSGDEVNNPSKYFDVKIFTGSAGAHTIPFGFQPDLIWHKERNNSQWHMLMDSVRGEGSQGLKKIYTNATDAEDSSFSEASNKITLDGNGVKLWSDGHVNSSGDKFVLWGWDAGTAGNGSTNTDGDNITVAVGDQWVNATSGFSITKYGGDGSGAANNDSGDAVGHGLSAAPDFVIIKRLDQNGWPTYHSSLNSTDHMNIQTRNAKEASNYCYPTHPTNTKVDIGNNPEVNNTGSNYIMYAWTAIPGYSHFSTYIGNNGDDGPFVYCGFRPRWILTKCTDAATTFWMMNDTERSPINMITSSTGGRLNAQGDNPESDFTSGYDIDILSNGFKIRDSGTDMNGNGNVYLFAAFAENPFKTARAR